MLYAHNIQFFWNKIVSGCDKKNLKFKINLCCLNVLQLVWIKRPKHNSWFGLFNHPTCLDQTTQIQQLFWVKRPKHNSWFGSFNHPTCLGRMTQTIHYFQYRTPYSYWSHNIKSYEMYLLYQNMHDVHLYQQGIRKWPMTKTLLLNNHYTHYLKIWITQPS